MRLHELYIDGFGHFHDRALGSLNSAITVLYGPNEAGKSTLLAFIRTVLFGFRRGGRREYYPPIAGGRHGGRITLSDDDGTVYTLERFEGPHGGPYVLRTDSGEVLADPAILQRLTAHVSLDLFSNIFAFSLDEMQSEGLMSDEEVSGRLYSAGMGASALPNFTRTLRSRRDDLFLPRGSAQQIARLIRELNDIDDQLRDIQGNAGRYHQLTSRQEAISRELTTVASEFSGLTASSAEKDRLLQGWDDWVALEGLEARLRDMPKFERFPESPIERLEDFQSRVRQAQNDRDEAVDDFQRIAEAAEAEIPGEALLDDAERIDAIRRGRTSFDDSVHDLPERQDELQELEDTLSQRLRALGHRSDEENLDTIDTSLGIQQQAEVWRDTLSEDAGKVEATRIRLEENRERLGTLRGEEQEAQQRLLADSAAGNPIGLRPPGNNLEELVADQEQIERIRRGRGSFDDSVRDLPERRAELGGQREDIEKRLRDLGQSWDEARLEAFDTSLVFRQETEGWRETLTTHGAHVHQANERLEREQSNLVDRQTAVSQAQSGVPDEQPPMDSSEIEIRRNALRTARSRLGEYAGLLNNLENLRGQLATVASGRTAGNTDPDGTPLILAAILGVVGIIFIVLGVVLGQEALLIGSAGGFVLLAVAAYLLFSGRSAQGVAENPLAAAIEANVRRAESAAEEARRLLVEAAQPLELDDEPTADALDNAEAELDTASKVLSDWNRANLRLEEAQNALEAQQKRVDEATTGVTVARDSESDVRQEWREWLSGHGLPEGFAPDTVVDFTGRVDTTRAVLGEMRRMQQRVSAIEVDIDEYTEIVRPLAASYGIPFEDASHQRIMSVADTLIESLELVRQLVIRRDDASKRLGQQEGVEAAASDEHSRAEKALQNRQAEWANWLRELGFDDPFTPEALLEFLARAETAQASSAETRRMRARVSAIEVDIDEFRNKVMPLAEAHGITMDSADLSQLAAAADTLIRRLEEAQALFSKRQQDRQLKEQQEQTLKRLEDRLSVVRGEFAAFLGAAGAEDGEDLRRRAAEHAQRLGLEAQRDERQVSLSRLSGPDEQLVAFRELLASSEREQLTEEFRVLGEQIEDADGRRDELRDERVANNIALEQLEGEEESSALRIERNILMEQLQEQAREWSRLTIAGEILRQTQQKFEQERQPSVIQHAEEFFGNVTGERYQRLYAPIGQQTITVIDEIGRDKSPPQLSRGTREQLYLALRFGLIREFGEHAEHLPVVVDEALVNFDAERANLAASAFAELSETNQVLVFTCHRTIADMFASIGANVIDIGRQSAA